MKKRQRWPDEICVSDYSPAGDYGKRFSDQGKPEHAGIPGGFEGDQNRDQGSRAERVQGKSGFGPDCELPRQRTAAREIRRIPPGLEESIRAAEIRREDAGIRSEEHTSELQSRGHI